MKKLFKRIGIYMATMYCGCSAGEMIERNLAQQRIERAIKEVGKLSSCQEMYEKLLLIISKNYGGDMGLLARINRCGFTGKFRLPVRILYQIMAMAIYPSPDVMLEARRNAVAFDLDLQALQDEVRKNSLETIAKAAVLGESIYKHGIPGEAIEGGRLPNVIEGFMVQSALCSPDLPNIDPNHEFVSKINNAINAVKHAIAALERAITTARSDIAIHNDNVNKAMHTAEKASLEATSRTKDAKSCARNAGISDYNPDVPHAAAHCDSSRGNNLEILRNAMELLEELYNDARTTLYEEEIDDCTLTSREVSACNACEAFEKAKDCFTRADTAAARDTHRARAAAAHDKYVDLFTRWVCTADVSYDDHCAKIIAGNHADDAYEHYANALHDAYYYNTPTRTAAEAAAYAVGSKIEASIKADKANKVLSTANEARVSHAKTCADAARKIADAAAKLEVSNAAFHSPTLSAISEYSRYRQQIKSIMSDAQCLARAVDERATACADDAKKVADKNEQIKKMLAKSESAQHKTADAIVAAAMNADNANLKLKEAFTSLLEMKIEDGVYYKKLVASDAIHKENIAFLNNFIDKLKASATEIQKPESMTNIINQIIDIYLSYYFNFSVNRDKDNDFDQYTDNISSIGSNEDLETQKIEDLWGQIMKWCNEEKSLASREELKQQIAAIHFSNVGE